MNKQEEIREGVISFFVERGYGRATDFTDTILNYLHSQGVVIKVERKLPTHFCECCKHYDTKAEEYFCRGGYCGNDYQKWELASYVAVEPLIKET